MQDSKRVKLTGRGISLHGNDVDTDRIIPARYLRTVVFDGLGQHAFEDDRSQAKKEGKVHPFDDARFADAEILLVNRNFGCGSSREHAPQAIARWGRGIKAIIGESFAEIFFGNCVALGLPCAVVSAEDVSRLMAAVETDPSSLLCVNLEARQVELGAQVFAFQFFLIVKCRSAHNGTSNGDGFQQRNRCYSSCSTNLVNNIEKCGGCLSSRKFAGYCPSWSTSFIT